MINSRNIEDLDPEAMTVCERHMALCSQAGITLIITSTYRDYEEQDELYAQGRTTPGKVVTHAQAGQSYHNFKTAWDCVPLKDGKADWNVEDPVFQQMITLGRQAGAEAGYDWSENKRDPDHFQVRPLNIQNVVEAKVAFDANGTIFTT